MDLGELRTAAYDFTGMSATQNNVSPIEVDRYLNEGQNDLHSKIALRHQSFFTAEATLNEVAGAKLINLPVDTHFLLRVDRVKTSGSVGGPLPYTMQRFRNNYRDRDQGRSFLAGQISIPGPQERGYVQLGQKQIEIVPAPLTSLTGSLEISYIYRPALMTDDTHVPFQKTAGTGGIGLDNLVEYHDLIYLYALIRMLNREAMGGEARAIQDGYDRRFVTMMADLQQMNLQEPDYIAQGDSQEMFDFFE